MITIGLADILSYMKFIEYVYIYNGFNMKFFLVLLVSTDPAHSLSDAFRCQFGAEPVSPDPKTLPNLDVMEVDPTATVQVFPITNYQIF